MAQRLSILFLFCSVFSYAPHEEITHCNSSYQYDDAGNPVALKVCMQQIIVPVVDGMRMEWQKEERIVEQLFPIHNQTQIVEHESSPSVQITKSATKLSRQKQSVCFQLSLPQRQDSKFYADVKMAPHQATVFESMSNREIMALALYDRYCLARYHMNSSSKYKMMGLSYKNFEQKLLSDQLLQDAAVWELWQEYKEKRLWNVGDEKKRYQQSIKQALGQRQKSRQQEIEKLFARIVQQEKIKAEQNLLQAYREKRLKKGAEVQASYESLKKFSQEHGLVCDEKCDRSLELSKLHCYEQYEVRYELDDQTRGYLLYKNIDYKGFENFIGTDLRQEYHAQTCEIFKDAAQLQSNIFHESELLTGACHFGVAAHEANKHEWADVTGALCWSGSQLVKYCAATIDVAQRYGA